MVRSNWMRPPATVETRNGARHLTPKLAALLEFFILHCNEVVPRSAIMEAIWQTSYLG